MGVRALVEVICGRQDLQKDPEGILDLKCLQNLRNSSTSERINKDM